MGSILDRIRLKPTQLRTVSDRRLADAECLRRSQANIHANGAIYLGGIVLECLLKAKLLEHHKWLQNHRGDLSSKTRHEQHLYSLCYQKHDLTALLENLPIVSRQLSSIRGRHQNLLEMLKKLCTEWTIHVRYSPKMTTIKAAGVFLDRIKELRQWLG